MLELILVRHGLSCANVWKQKLPPLHKIYSDPELTERGKELSEERRDTLKEILHSYFPNGSYKVGTSCLIRAQQTAYHMLLKHTEKQFSILPHIAENGFMYNDYPFPSETQKTILGPTVYSHIDSDFRGKVVLKDKSDWSSFLRWLYAHKDEVCAKTEDNHYRLVIFTHGGFIRHSLHEKDKVQNNDIFYVKVEGDRIVEKKRLTTFPTLSKEIRQSTDGCRIRTYRNFFTHKVRIPKYDRKDKTRKHRR